jgi:serine phosphatase RsbU (regulator of sigma subunit)
MFNKERVKTLIKEHRSDSANRILDAIIKALSEFRGDRFQDDDVTLVVIKVD